MLSLLAAAACLLSNAFAQTPPSYTLAKTNLTLGLTYGSVSVKAGETLPYKGPLRPLPLLPPPLKPPWKTNPPPPVPTYAPTLSTPIPLNATYIAIIVDTTANLSSPIPASLVWFQQDVTFSPATGVGSAATPAQVPYQSPTSVGHAYLALIYAQPPGFVIPPDFPYTNTFRSNFNVSRVAVDFKTPLLEANWFVLGSNCSVPSYTASSGFLASTGFASGTHGAYPKKTDVVYANGARGRY